MGAIFTDAKHICGVCFGDGQSAAGLNGHYRSHGPATQDSSRHAAWRAWNRPGAAENESMRAVEAGASPPLPGRVLVAERQCIPRRSRINVGAIRVQGLGESVRSEELDAVA